MNVSPHWRRHARQWSMLASPLRPAASDIRFMVEEVTAWRRAHTFQPMRVVVLGVTPEIVGISWPPGTFLLAIDHDRDMIQALWRASTAARVVMVGDWRALPLSNGCVDLVLGDGVFVVLGRQATIQNVLDEVRRVLAADGRLVLRHFLRPELAETPRDVFDDLEAGHIGSFHSFKWRLAHALHGAGDEGVRLHDVWQMWTEHQPAARHWCAAAGWSPEVVATLDAYRDVATRYMFPTQAQLEAMTAPFFHTCRAAHMDYELADLCPTTAYSKWRER